MSVAELKAVLSLIWILGCFISWWKEESFFASFLALPVAAIGLSAIYFSEVDILSCLISISPWFYIIKDNDSKDPAGKKISFFFFIVLVIVASVGGYSYFHLKIIGNASVNDGVSFNIGYNHSINDLLISKSEFKLDESNILHLSITIKNNSDYSVDLPSLEIGFYDSNETLLVKKIVDPVYYDIPTQLNSRDSVSFELNFSAAESMLSNINNFRALIFYKRDEPARYSNQINEEKIVLISNDIKNTKQIVSESPLSVRYLNSFDLDEINIKNSVSFSFNEFKKGGVAVLKKSVMRCWDDYESKLSLYTEFHKYHLFEYCAALDLTAYRLASDKLKYTNSAVDDFLSKSMSVERVESKYYWDLGANRLKSINDLVIKIYKNQEVNL